jgi:outer membrane murein-binding lipoprotein Lpp
MVVGLTFALAGCDSDARPQLESDAKRLEAKCDALKRENETQRLAVDNLRAEKAVMEKDLARLQSDNNSLKTELDSEKGSAAVQIDELKAQLAAARQATLLRAPRRPRLRPSPPKYRLPRSSGPPLNWTPRSRPSRQG